MEMAAGSSPIERLTELKNTIKAAWPKALQGSLKNRWRPFNCCGLSIKKVPALNSCSLCPESGTLPPLCFAAGYSYSFSLPCAHPHHLPTAQRTPSTCPTCPPQRICQPYPHVIRQANDCLPESHSRTSACGRIAPIRNTDVF